LERGRRRLGQISKVEVTSQAGALKALVEVLFDGRLNDFLATVGAQGKGIVRFYPYRERAEKGGNPDESDIWTRSSSQTLRVKRSATRGKHCFNLSRGEKPFFSSGNHDHWNSCWHGVLKKPQCRFV